MVAAGQVAFGAALLVTAALSVFLGRSAGTRCPIKHQDTMCTQQRRGGHPHLLMLACHENLSLCDITGSAAISTAAKVTAAPGCMVHIEGVLSDCVI